MKIKFKKLYEDAKMPTKGSPDDSTVDLYAYIRDGIHTEIAINPKCKYPFGSGLAVEIPEGYVGLIMVRGSIGNIQQLAPPYCAGVISSGYRGEMTLSLQNTGSTKKTVKHGDCIAQLLVVPSVFIEPEETNELTQTERGTKGINTR